MLQKTLFKALLIVFFTFHSISYGLAENQEIKIIGLKIFTEESLLQQTGLNDNAGETYNEISKKIISYYQNNGYILATAYLIRKKGNTMTIFVDEGRIGRIIFHGLNSIDTIKMKYDFNFKERIYNKGAIRKETDRLKKKYGFKEINCSLDPAPEGDSAFFQLDNKIIIPWIGSARLPFFDEHSSRFNLNVDFIKQESRTSSSLTYGLRTSLSKGLIPYIEYGYPNLIRENDKLEIGSSIGLFYGLDLKFTTPPTWKFIETHSNYYFTPFLKGYFTPMASVSAYYSMASRPDIGLLSYKYLKLNGIIAPGITLLKKLHIYAGLGGEKVFIYPQEIDPEAEYTANAKEETETWAVFESRLKLDIRPWTLKKTKRQGFETKYNYYVNDKHFHELNTVWNGELEFQNLDSYNITIEQNKIWNDPPFYHEYPVSGENFKGFMGKNYYTRNVFRFSNEYKISVYRDLYYVGVFIDFAAFKGYYDLEGNQQGIVGGLGGHIIFWDQFEFNIYYGKDYLFSAGESQYNLYLNICKKW